MIYCEQFSGTSNGGAAFWLLTTTNGVNTELNVSLEVIKLFSSSAQLSMKFQLLINVVIVKISGKFRFISHKLVI